jgi:hypothetical protein
MRRFLLLMKLIHSVGVPVIARQRGYEGLVSDRNFRKTKCIIVTKDNDIRFMETKTLEVSLIQKTNLKRMQTCFSIIDLRPYERCCGMQHA